MHWVFECVEITRLINKTQEKLFLDTKCGPNFEGKKNLDSESQKSFFFPQRIEKNLIWIFPKIYIFF